VDWDWSVSMCSESSAGRGRSVPGARPAQCTGLFRVLYMVVAAGEA
jgi:hypothetical protein